MNVLLQIKDPGSDKEFKDFTKSLGHDIFISRSAEESIHILNSNKIDQAIVSLKGLTDGAILKYINDYHPSTDVVVLTSRDFNDMVSLFRNTRYSVVYEPLKFSELAASIPKRRNLA
ncbi:MAG: hypothetical protein ACNA7V_09130 [Bacteroidales bacterium]